MNKITLSKIILIIVDFTTLTLPLFLSLIFLGEYGRGLDSYFPISQLHNYITIHSSISVATVFWLWLRLRHYTYRKPLWFELKEVLRTLAIFFVIELAIIALSKLYVSRSFWCTVWGISFFLMPTMRILVKKALIKCKFFIKETVIIGNGKNAREVYNAIKAEKYLGFYTKLFVSTDNIQENFIEGIPVIGHNPELLLKITDKEFTQFILAIEDNNIEKQDFWLRFLMKKSCRSVSVIPNLRGLPVYGTDMSFLFSHDLILLRLNNNLAKLSSRIIKRSIDIIGSVILLIVLSPLLFTLYILIKQDGGNAIYRHNRMGRNNKTFDCYKFRSMVVNSQEVLEELLNSNPTTKKEWEKDFKLKNDPRITAVGHFLRKTSLDELPQLFNVLKGEMSLVGPRPITKEEIDRYEEDYDYYFMAKPGMTGLWQVSGRNDVDYETRVFFDSWYAKNWSIWNDMVILFKTIDVVLGKRGAY